MIYDYLDFYFLSILTGIPNSFYHLLNINCQLLYIKKKECSDLLSCDMHVLPSQLFLFLTKTKIALFVNLLLLLLWLTEIF